MKCYQCETNEVFKEYEPSGLCPKCFKKLKKEWYAQVEGDIEATNYQFKSTVVKEDAIIAADGFSPASDCYIKRIQLVNKIDIMVNDEIYMQTLTQYQRDILEAFRWRGEYSSIAREHNKYPSQIHQHINNLVSKYTPLTSTTEKEKKKNGILKFKRKSRKCLRVGTGKNEDKTNK